MRRIASLDSPFREFVGWAYLQISCRPGVPPRDNSTAIEAAPQRLESPCHGRQKMIAVDLFCGAGGLTRGLLNAGVNVVLGIDSNEDCTPDIQEEQQAGHVSM